MQRAKGHPTGVHIRCLVRCEALELLAEQRPEVKPERSAHAPAAADLDQTRPDEGLLEGDPRQPPRRDVPRAAEAWREAAEEHPSEHEQAQLDGVEEIRRHRQADALQHVAFTSLPHELGETLLGWLGGGG
jgi:hypothetical protein